MRNAIIATSAVAWFVKVVGLVAACIVTCSCGDRVERPSTGEVELRCWTGSTEVRWMGRDVRPTRHGQGWIVDGDLVTTSGAVCSTLTPTSAGRAHL